MAHMAILLMHMLLKLIHINYDDKMQAPGQD